MANQGVKTAIKAYVGIDFGTSNCGVAYAKAVGEGVKADIKMVKLSQDSIGKKAPTTIVLTNTEPHSFVAFGSGVLNDFEEPDHLLFHHFKMQLYDNPLRETLKPDIGSTEVPTQTVIARCLEYFKDTFVETFREEEDDDIDGHEVCWVITVPAIWDEGAKVRMRQAAHMAGLVDHPAATNLIVALEPECAAIFLNRDQKIFHVNSTFAVLDCGGGTVDTTIHQVMNEPPNLDLKELRAASGGDYGSTRIDTAVLDLLAEVFKYRGTDRDVADYNVDDESTWVQIPELHGERQNTAVFGFLTDSFEGIKHGFGNDAIQSAPIDLSCFNESIIKLHGSIANAVQAYNAAETQAEKRLQLEGVKLILPETVMEELFDTSLLPLKAHIRNNILGESFLEDKPDEVGVDRIILTGGFSAARKVQRIVRRAIQNVVRCRTRMVTAYENSLSIVYGAVLFGLQPRTISTRVVRVNYGIQVSKEWQDGMPPEYKQKFGQRWMVTNAFKLLVKEGDKVDYNQTIEKKFKPLPGSAAIDFTIYSSPEVVKFIDDPKCRVLGQIKFDKFDATKDPNENKVKFKLFFGRTNVEVTATGPDGHEEHLDIDLIVHNK